MSEDELMQQISIRNEMIEDLCNERDEFIEKLYKLRDSKKKGTESDSLKDLPSNYQRWLRKQKKGTESGEDEEP